MQKISSCLWFDNEAEEAANFYVSIFKNSKVTDVVRYNDTVAEVANRPAGSVMTVSFELDGQEFMGLNGGPLFRFSEAISFVVHCEDQSEVDDMWQKLIAGGGQPSQCGWLKDRFGVSWQVVPKALEHLFTNPATAGRVGAALMRMTKIDIGELERAASG